MPMIFIRAGELANILEALAPNFFLKPLQLQLLIFSQTLLAPGIFFLAAPAPRDKKLALAPDRWLSLAKYSLPSNLVL